MEREATSTEADIGKHGQTMNTMNRSEEKDSQKDSHDQFGREAKILCHNGKSFFGDQMLYSFLFFLVQLAGLFLRSAKDRTLAQSDTGLESLSAWSKPKIHKVKPVAVAQLSNPWSCSVLRNDSQNTELARLQNKKPKWNLALNKAQRPCPALTPSHPEPV